MTKGFRASRHNLYRQSLVTLIRGRVYAFRDRRAKKRDFRRLWIIRIGAAARLNQLTYSQFINGLKKLNIGLDRKVLAELAVRDAAGFAELAAKVRDTVESQKSTVEQPADVGPGLAPA